MLQLGLGLGTGNGYVIPFFSFFFPCLEVTNTFVLPSWAEAWCKCDVMLFICDCLHGSLPLITPRHDKFFSHTYTQSKKKEGKIPFPGPSPNPNCNTMP